MKEHLCALFAGVIIFSGLEASNAQPQNNQQTSYNYPPQQQQQYASPPPAYAYPPAYPGYGYYPLPTPAEVNPGEAQADSIYRANQHPPR